MFFGSIPALVTPFSGGRVAEDTFREHIEWQIAEGSSALVPCGTTGESATLSVKEHLRVVQLCVDVANRRVPVIAGAGSNSTAHAIELTKGAKEIGADAVLVNTAIAQAKDPTGMAESFRLGVEAGRMAYLAGRSAGKQLAEASSPLEGVARPA